MRGGGRKGGGGGGGGGERREERRVDERQVSTEGNNDFAPSWDLYSNIKKRSLL